MSVKSYIDGVVVFACPICKRDNAVEIPVDFAPVFVEEMGEYENLHIDCPFCETEGRKVTNVVNMNIPEFDEMELDVMEVLAPEEEVLSRQVVRDVMWAKRPDLKGRNRAAAKDEFMSKNKKFVEEMRNKVIEMKEERANENRGKSNDNRAAATT